ncbi:unnamed protein product [Schistosoma rodhaini]|nr:unnamed protein product [Schistosoma rodhaini]
MAEFRKCFDNLDTEKRGVITIEDLKNYMFKMHYKETFLHKWIELFDPEHTGFITYEQYCKTLGLIPRKRTLSKDFTDSTLSSSSSLSVSLKQDNINEVSIGSFDKHVDETNTMTVIQRSHSNEPQQTIEQPIITEPPPPQQQQIDQTIKDTCPLQQSEVEIIETEHQQKQQQPEELPNQPNSSIHQNINIESTNIIVHDEKLNIRRKRKYIDENQKTMEENIVSPIQNDILFETTELTNSNHNGNQFIESLKEINNEINNLSDQLNISSQQPQLTTNQTMPNFSEKKSIKKSKRKQKHLLSLETKTLKQNEEMTIDTKMIPSDNEHNELLSSIIIPMTNNYEIQMTDITYTTTTTTTITSSNIPKEISSIQFNINNDPIDQSSINHKHEEDLKHLETKQTSQNKEIDIKKQYETTSIQPSNYSFITESTISISTDSGHSEASDITLSSVEIPIKKEEEDMLLYDSNSLNILQNDNEMPTSTLLSTESNQFNEYCLSNETNQEKNPDLHHDNQIFNQTIEKSNKKSIKKKQKPNTLLEQIIDPINSQSINLIHQSINQQSSSAILPKTDDNLLITDNQSISELLIIPKNIPSISRSPQGMSEEIDADHTVELLSPKELVTNGKKIKKNSKNSTKKHEKKNGTINSNSDGLQVVNIIDVEMISEHRHEEDINPSVIENQSDKINISCSDTTFPELNSIDPQSECIIEQVPTKQNIVILEVNNPSEQILNESQIIISNDNIPTTELTYTSSKVPIDDHYITTEYIEEVQFNNINNNNGNDTLVKQSSLRKDDVNKVITEMTLCDLELNIEHEDTNENSLKQSKKKHKKTKEPTEKNITAADNHENTTNTSELTSFQESFIPQSAITTTDVSRTVDSPLYTDLQTKEQTLHPTISKKKHKKTKEPTEKNITAADNHENTTSTSELTSFQESFIPQSAITTTDVSRTVNPPLSTDLQTKEQTLHPTISKKKHKKTKEPTEKNITAADNHENTTSTSELTSFQESFIPQSAITTTDVSRTVNPPLSTDLQTKEQTLHPTISKKKHKKTKEPTEKNITAADNHENTTSTSELTSFQESFIPQSAITTTDVSRTVNPPLSTDLQTKEQTLHPTISKKKHKKTKEPTEKNITAADNHENTTNTSELTSFQESFIPQSTITTTDVSRTVDSPLYTDLETKEQTLQTTKSMTSSQPSDGFSKKSSRNRKTKKGKTQSHDNHSSNSTLSISSNSLIPVDEVHSTVYNISSSSSSNSRNLDINNFTSLSIPFCKTICKVSHEELQNSLSHRSTSSLKSKNKKLHLKRNKLKNSKTNILNQMDNTLNDEMTIEQLSQTVNEEETQENTRKRRFPKSFITQVDPRYNRSVRLAAKRRKTDSTHKAKEASPSSTDERKTTIQQKTKQIIKKWHIRPSLRENGVIVILLAGRHRGKRVVSLGQHKSTGLLLVTGPYCYNGCPLRRIHPDYVIATKTKIDLSSLSLPERIHTKKYFSRSTTCKKFKKSHQQNRFADILDHGVTKEQSTYQPNNEKKMDQIYIDNE